MKIIYFSRDYTSHDFRFLSALATTEHDVYYLRLERRGHQQEDRPIPKGIHQVAWAGGQTPVNLKNAPRLLLDLKRVIREIQPDLIQAGPLQRSAFLVALTGFRPLVSMSWGYDLLQDANRNTFWRWCTRFTLKRSAAMVGDCDTIRHIAISFGMPDERIVIFPWGVDLEHFAPDNLHTMDSSLFNNGGANQLPSETESMPFTLLSTRSWEPVYGVDVIAHAFIQAVKRRPEIRLVMLGNGSQAPILRRILQSSSMQGNSDVPSMSRYDRVLCPGQINHAELPRFYRSADLYVAATHSDGTSISMLEAMASGLPVLVSDIPGNREWVTPGVNGWLSPEGDADALAEAIVHAVDMRESLPGMGSAARQTAEQRADWKSNFRTLFEAYDIANGKARS